MGNIYTTILTPKIHQGVWPDFCIHHLQIDPEGCSAWSCKSCRDPVELELFLYGSSHVHIDQELISSLEHLIYFIPSSNTSCCDYACCPSCQQTVIRAVSCDDEDEDYNEEYPEAPIYDYSLIYHCTCHQKYGWWMDSEDAQNSTWQFCSAPAIYYGYLDWNNRTYFHQLKNFLLYVEENPTCSCYWPQIDQQAQTISDKAYVQLEKILTPLYSDHFIENFTPHLLKNTTSNLLMPPVQVFTFLYREDDGKKTLHEMLSSSLTHAFFYTHYRHILSDFNRYILQEQTSRDYLSINPYLMEVEEEIQTSFLELYGRCLKKHPHPKIHYERGMVLFHRGDNLDALEDIRRFISYAEQHQYQALLTSDFYLKEGLLLSESLSYDEAIIALTKAIEKDPKNTAAYFERAIAYFETGCFEMALSDYLASGIRPKQVDPKTVAKLNYVAFNRGIALGMLQGGQDSIVEFVPSILSCCRGINKGLWAFVSHPIALSQDMIDSACACIEFIKDNTTKEALFKLVPEIQECLATWNQLDDDTKGKYIGHVIGKYGIDIFIGVGSVKAITLYRNLRKANALMTLETVAASPQLAKEVLELSVKEEVCRNKLLKSGNIKIQWDKQGKHIKGHKNYIPKENRSILIHKDPQKLVDKYAGTGRKAGHGIPGKPGYKEIINFEESIGYFVDKETGKSFITTWGSIDYAKGGVHIIPRQPR